MEIVHWKVLVPTLKPDTEEEGEEGEAIVPVPAMSVHRPVPVTGVLAAKLEDVTLHKI